MSGQDATWVAVGLSAVAAVVTIFNTITGRLARRDQLEFDAKTQRLESDHEKCREKTAALEAKTTEMDRKLDLAEAKADAAEKRVRECEEKHQQSETDRAEMRGRLDVLERIAVQASDTPSKVNRMIRDARPPEQQGGG